MTSKQITDIDVINYLTINSDFFTRHPEQLEALKVTNNKGNVASLINHQVNVLMERNTQLKARLSQLIVNAAGNEKIMSQVFELTLQLCQISHVANVTKHFGRFVKQSFDSDLFKIVMPVYESLESSSTVLCIEKEREDEFFNIFKEFFVNNIPISGRLKKDKLKFIFGNNAEKIGSSVILPIGKNSQKGLIVFASFDESRFNPDISTDLLSRLSHILDRKFSHTFSNIEKLKAQS
jgi:uncharacterized protein YigA (DUF484 family)